MFGLLFLWLVGHGCHVLAQNRFIAVNDAIVVHVNTSLFDPIYATTYVSLAAYSTHFGPALEYVKISWNKTFAHVDTYIDNQCIEVQTTWKISQPYCSLPPYCGQSVYFKQKSGWLVSDVGICLGLGDTMFVPYDGTQFPSTPSNWCKVMNVKPLKQLDHEIVFNILECTSGLYTISTPFLLHHPLIDDSFIVIKPELIEFQGKYCIPQVLSSRYPILLGPYDTLEEAAGNAYFFPYNHLLEKSVSFCYDYFQCYDTNRNKMINALDNMHLRCDAFKQSSSLLPFEFNYFSKIVGNIFYIFCRVLYTLILSGLKFLFNTLLIFIDPFIFSIFLFYSYFYSSRSLSDIIILSIFAGVVFAYIFHPPFARYDAHSFVVRPGWTGF